MALSATAAKKKPVRRSKQRVRDALTGYAFMTPTLIGFALFIFYPLGADIVYSLTNWNGLTAPDFVGFKNYHYLFTVDTLFLKSIGATFYYVLLTVPTSLVVGLLLALLVNKSIPGIKLFRTVFYLPVVLPAVATLVMFKFFFSSNKFGVANQILSVFHLPTVQWLTSTSTVMPTLAIMNLWTVGGGMVIFLAGLQSVPAELYEAADIDGAKTFRKFWSITIPMISPILELQLITTVIGALQILNPPLLITPNGAPNHATYFINYNIYMNAFVNNKYGMAMAESIILLIIISIITIPIFKISDAYTYYESSDN